MLQDSNLYNFTSSSLSRRRTAPMGASVICHPSASAKGPQDRDDRNIVGRQGGLRSLIGDTPHPTLG